MTGWVVFSALALAAMGMAAGGLTAAEVVFLAMIWRVSLGQFGFIFVHAGQFVTTGKDYQAGPSHKHSLSKRHSVHGSGSSLTSTKFIGPAGKAPS
jgi:hypothetical protein